VEIWTVDWDQWEVERSDKALYPCVNTLLMKFKPVQVKF
jgi:hypothetical protein